MISAKKILFCMLLLVLPAGSMFLLSGMPPRDTERGATSEPGDTVFRNSRVLEAVAADFSLASGLERAVEWRPKALTPAPRGYEAVFVEHYGRHGSRYAYSDKTYSTVYEMLKEGAATGNLTPFGASLWARVEPFWEKVRYQVGDLTPLGWEQHRRIASIMAGDYPTAFGKGSKVFACSSPSARAMVSMTSFCTSLSREAPKTEIYAHQGLTDINAVRPNVGKNPFVYTGPACVFPYEESLPDFFYRKCPFWRDVLGRIFKDTDSAVQGRQVHDVFFFLNLFVAGMQNLPDDVRINVDGIFTPKEYALIWEADNYIRLWEYLKYRTPCSSIVDDFIAKADRRLSCGERGADLRFGHDHVLIAVLMVMDIDGFGYLPESPDEVAFWFQSYRSPKAANIQLVFYTPKKGRSGDTLVKVLLNGDEARLGTLAAKEGPYYRWEDAKEWLRHRVSLFTD